MFVPSMTRRGPGLTQQSMTRQPYTPVAQPWSSLCHCQCHIPQKPPPAVEARLCQECADERFTAWQSLVEVLMRDD
jgi:hypothetical protein